MPNVMECSTMPIFALELDRDGHLSRKTMKLAREEQLKNTLLQEFYPGIRVATVDVPTEPLDACEQAIVEQALTRVEFDGGAHRAARDWRTVRKPADFVCQAGTALPTTSPSIRKAKFRHC